MLIISDFSNGGTVSTITAYRWDPTCTAANKPNASCGDANLRLLANLSGPAAQCTTTRTAPENLVFGNRSGKPLRESKLLRNVLQPAAKRAGLGRVTWLNDLKVPVKIAQEQLGHASISATLNIYTHVVDASHRAAIEQLERQLFPTVPKSQEADSASESENTDENGTREAPAAASVRLRSGQDERGSAGK